MSPIAFVTLGVGRGSGSKKLCQANMKDLLTGKKMHFTDLQNFVLFKSCHILDFTNLVRFFIKKDRYFGPWVYPMGSIVVCLSVVLQSFSISETTH